jgi:metacaspase-1
VLPSIAIHVGVNAVDPSIYGEWEGRLGSCEADALAMHALARDNGFDEQHLLLTPSATRANLTAVLYFVRDQLTSGGRLLLTFAGHGTSFDSTVEPDTRDQAWCLHDGLFRDKRVNAFLGSLAPEVDVLIVSDSCFSGTMTDVPFPEGERERCALAYAIDAARAAAPEEPAALAALAASADDPAQDREPACSVLLLAACPDDRPARETAEHGLFTAALLAAWNAGKFQGTHDAFLHAIAARMPTQQPQLRARGPEDDAFRTSRPFTWPTR